MNYERANRIRARLGLSALDLTGPPPMADKVAQGSGAPVIQPGTELKKLLDKLGLKPASGCKCAQRIKIMNHRGIEWCRDNVDTIVGWLKEEAQRAKLPFTTFGAKIIVKRAIANTERMVNQMT